MKKNTILYVLIGFLAISNVLFLLNFLGEDHKSKKRKSSKDFIKTELQLDASQMAQFEVLSNQHEAAIGKLSDSIIRLKELMYKQMFEDQATDAFIDSMIVRIGDFEEQKDTKWFYYLKDIYELSDASQKERLNTMIKEALYKKAKRLDKNRSSE